MIHVTDTLGKTTGRASFSPSHENAGNHDMVASVSSRQWLVGMSQQVKLTPSNCRFYSQFAASECISVAKYHHHQVPTVFNRPWQVALSTVSSKSGRSSWLNFDGVSDQGCNYGQHRNWLSKSVWWIDVVRIRPRRRCAMWVARAHPIFPIWMFDPNRPRSDYRQL